MHGQFKLVAPILALVSFAAATMAAEPVSKTSAEGSPSKMVAQAKAILGGAERTTQVVSQALREARRNRDIVKALCLDDKLAQLEVAKLSVGDRVASLEGAVSTGNTEAVDHDFSIVNALGQRITALSDEANQCIGAEKAATGEGPSLNVTFSPDIPKEDTSSLPTSPNTSTPPVAASPVI
jgi:hypothetical protein